MLIIFIYLIVNYKMNKVEYEMVYYRKNKIGKNNNFVV